MTTPSATGALAGIKVLDLGQYVAGPGTAMILADQGADVIRIEKPDGPSMSSPANAVLNRGKRIMTLDLKTPADLKTARGLAASADVVIENFRPGVMARLGLGADDLTALNPGLVYLSLPGFSADDAENAAIPAWEGVVAAATGQFTDMGLNRILMGIEASYSPLTLASAYASAFGAMSVMLALRARLATGVGDIVEVPLAAALMEGLVYNAMSVENLPRRYKSLREREIERRRAAGMPMDLSYQQVQRFLDPFYRSYMCRDGRPFYVVSLAHATHAERALKVLGLWDEMVAQGLPRADAFLPIGAFPNGEDCSIKGYPMTEPWAGRLSARMAEVFLTKDSFAWERLFGEAGAPAAAHRTTREWLHSEHSRAAGLVIEVRDAVHGRMLQPGPLAWLVGQPATVGRPPAASSEPNPPAFGKDHGDWPWPTPRLPLPERPEPWLAGVTILDLTNVIAGPTVAGTLSRFGARVIKLDAVTPTFDPWNTVGMGFYCNRGKESTLVDIKTDAGREVLRRLVAQVDVVTINAATRQLAGLGLEFDTLRTINPRIILCHLDAFGGPGVGPRSDYTGYDDLVQASTGIMERFGGSLETVEEHAHLGTIDVLGGLVAAFAVSMALLRREVTGQGDFARTSLAAAGQWLQSRFMVDFDGRPPFDEPRGRDVKGEGPLYRCYQAADHWFFFAARPGDVQRLASSDLLAGLRRVAPEAREAWLEEVFRTRPVAVWAEHLRPFDVAVQPLRSLADLRMRSLNGPTAGATIAFQREVGHPSGRVVEHTRPNAVRPRRAPLVETAAAEQYGRSTRRILRTLDYSGPDIEWMIQAGIVSDRWSKDYLPD